MKDAQDVIQIIHLAIHVKVATIYMQVEIYKYVDPVEMKIYLALVNNAQQWGVHNAKMVILNLVLNVIVNSGIGSEFV